MKTKSWLGLAALGGALALALCVSFSASAAVVAVETFESYADGQPLSGQNGGSGWAGPWLAPVGATASDVADTTAAPLVFTPASGGSLAGLARAGRVWSTVDGGTGNNPAAPRQLAAPLTETFYARYLLRYETTGGGNFASNNTFSLHFASGANTTASLNFGIRAGMSTNHFMVRNGTGAPLAGDALPQAVQTGVTYLLVARYNYSANGTFDTLDAWLNPDYSEAATPHLSLSLAAGTGASAITHLFFRSAANQADDRFLFDELVVGTSWDDVLPSPTTPQIGDLAPVSGALCWEATNGLSFTVSSPAPIEPEGLRLILNGIEVSPELVISGPPTQRAVSYTNLAANTRYTAQIIASNLHGASTTWLHFDTYGESTAVVIEAEDYNYDVSGDCVRPWTGFYGDQPGAYQNRPPASGFDLDTGLRVGGLQPGGDYQGYADTLGAPEVDYYKAGMNPYPTGMAYRWCDGVGTRAAGDQRRAKYTALNLPEYEVYEVGAGDWMNYTRDVPLAHYKAYLRVASAGGGRVQLSRVTSAPTLPNQTVAPAGTFIVPNTGGLSNFVYVPLTDAAGGTEVTVQLGGAETVRLTGLEASTNLAINFLVLVSNQVSVLPPVAAFDTPTNGATYPAKANIPVSVSVSDPDGTVATVAVWAVSLNRTNLLATMTTPPYSFTWSNAVEDTYTLIAEATDNQGLTGRAIPVSLTIGTPPSPALFVAGATPLSAGDQSVVNRLAALGFPVVVRTAAESQTSDAEGKRLVVISSSVMSTDVADKFTAVAVPVINWEQALVDDFFISAVGMILGGQQDLTITAAGAAHPLGAGLPAGAVTVRTTPTGFHLGRDNNLAPGAVVIARAATPTNTLPAIIAVDTGGLLNNGSSAAARRVMMFWGDEGLTGVNATGLALFDAAVQWATGGGAPILAVRLAGDQLAVSWPIWVTGETLQENSDLANPSGWTDLTLPVDDDGANKIMMIPLSAGHRFFRLARP